MFDVLDGALNWLGDLGSTISSWGSDFANHFSNLFPSSSTAKEALPPNLTGSFGGASNMFTGPTIESALPSSAINDYSNAMSTASNSLMPGEWDWMKGGTIGGMKVPGLLEGGLGLAKYLQSSGQADQTRSTGTQAAQVADPFGTQRALYQQKLRDLYSNPDLIKAIPGYGAGLNAGTDAIRRNAAKSGRLDSGNINYDLMDYSTKYAMDQFNNQAQQLAGLSGAGINPSEASKMLYQSNQDAQKQSAYGLQALADPWKDANNTDKLNQRIAQIAANAGTTI